MIRICFVSLYAYPLFNPAMVSPFGGSEVRSWLLGVGLSRLPENEVSFVVFDHGQPEVEQFDRVKLYRHSYYKSEARNSPSSLLLSRYLERRPRFPFVKIKRMEWEMLADLSKALLYRIGSGCAKLLDPRRGTSLLIHDYRIEPSKTRIYEQVDADVYCGFGVSPLTGEIAAFCTRSHKKFVLFAGSDIDFSPEHSPQSLEVNPCGSQGDICNYALMHADLIVTQTDTQRRLLRERFGKEGVMLRSPIDLSDIPSDDKQGTDVRNIALWIGKSNQIKRPDILLQLAAAFPGIEFVMVLNLSDPDIFQAVLRDRPPNVQVLEWIPFEEVERLFAQALVLINTSLFEGFPNTFLQAGKYAVPLLSLQVDPDGFIEGYECGIVARGRFDMLVEGLDVIRSDQARHSLFARNIRGYVQKHHSLAQKVRQLDQILAALKSNG